MLGGNERIEFADNAFYGELPDVFSGAVAELFLFFWEIHQLQQPFFEQLIIEDCHQIAVHTIFYHV